MKKRLVLFLFAIVLVWVALQFHSSHPHDPIDIGILVGLGSLFMLTSFAMIWGTNDWSLWGLGVLGTVTGDAIFYSSRAFGILGRSPVPEWVTDWVRSFFLVGSPLFFIGVISFVATKRKEKGGKEWEVSNE